MIDQIEQSLPVRYATRPRGRNMVAACLLMIPALMSGVCVAGLSSPRHSTAAAASLSSHPAKQGVVTLKVYFSRFPQSANDFSAVFPLARVASPTDIQSYAVQLLVAGPTPSERRVGYFSELNSLLTGPSACSAPYPTGGPDFTLRLDRKGSRVERGTATLTFCRVLSSPGVGADARVRAEITATLIQFARIRKVVILTKDGHCFGDGSGADRCLR